MNSPYTSQPGDALMAAQTSVGLALGALAWSRRAKAGPALALFCAAIALAVVAPVEPDFLRGMGAKLEPEHFKSVLRIAALLAVGAAAVTRQRVLVVAAAAGALILWAITGYIKECEWELAAAHLAFFGLLVGLQGADGVHREKTEEPAAPARPLSPPVVLERDDLVAFGLGTLGGCLVCWLVLHGGTDSADEWADTFQAALFARLHAYGSVPHCSEAFRSFWVFQYMGRAFAQYTPGWPFFMTPFVALHAAWLAGPVSLGLLASGVGRLSRRAAAGVGAGEADPPASHTRAAGAFGALVICLSTTLLINGGSRYPHVFTAALWAWAIEALCVVSTGAVSVRDERRWGLALGACAALLLATRPGDGATLGLGLFLYFVYAVARRRIGWQAVAAATGAVAVIGGLSLFVLRLQLGEWFKTGYSLTEVFYPWAPVKMSWPKPNEFRWGIPIGTGAYCWWPCSPAVGLAGLAMLRGRARRLGFVFFCGAVPLVALCTALEFGRGYDFGYGPRYELPLVVPMAVGTAVAFATLWRKARSPLAPGETAFEAAGPMVLALTAVFLGLVRLAPLLYPPAYQDAHAHNRLRDAIAELRPHNAIVFGGQGLNTTDPMDLTENLPLDLYPDQDVLVAIDRGPDAVQCVKTHFPGRSYYRAIPGDPVRLVPY